MLDFSVLIFRIARQRVKPLVDILQHLRRYVLALVGNYLPELFRRGIQLPQQGKQPLRYVCQNRFLFYLLPSLFPHAFDLPLHLLRVVDWLLLLYQVFRLRDLPHRRVRVLDYLPAHRVPSTDLLRRVPLLVCPFYHQLFYRSTELRVFENPHFVPKKSIIRGLRTSAVGPGYSLSARRSPPPCLQSRSESRRIVAALFSTSCLLRQLCPPPTPSLIWLLSSLSSAEPRTVSPRSFEPRPL